MINKIKILLPTKATIVSHGKSRVQSLLQDGWQKLGKELKK